ncbi:MAG: DUF111 family protein [Deltaproteobacteria bacterium]|nr:DUF111 family protein [Deltaproteobacteria bacterium]
MSSSSKRCHFYFDLRSHASAEGLVAALLDFADAEAKMREALDAAHIFGAGPQLKEAKRDRALGRLLLWVDDKGLALSHLSPDTRREGSVASGPTFAEGSASSRRKRSQESKKDFRRRDAEVVSIVEQDESEANALHLSLNNESEQSLRKIDQQRPEPAKGRIRAWLDGDDVGSSALKALLQESRLSPLTKMVAMKALAHWVRSLAEASGLSTTEVAIPGREALRALLNFIAFAALLEELGPLSVRCSSLPRGKPLALAGFSDEVMEHWSLSAAQPLLLQGTALFGVDPVAASILSAVCRDNISLPSHQVKAVARGGCGVQHQGWVWLQALSFSAGPREQLCVRALLQTKKGTQQEVLDQELLQGGAIGSTLSQNSEGTQLELIVEKDAYEKVVGVLLKAGATNLFAFEVQIPQVEEFLHTVVVGKGKHQQSVRVVTRIWNQQEILREVLAEDIRRASDASGFSPTSIEEEALMMFKQITSSTREEKIS